MEREIYKPRGAKGCSQPPEARKRQNQRFFLKAFRESRVRGYLDFRLSASRSGRESISVVSLPPAPFVGISYSGPRETNTATHQQWQVIPQPEKAT